MPTLTTPAPSRRRFLQAGACAAGAFAALATRPRYAFATPSDPSLGDAVVVVFLRGAADGLSMAPPIGAAYDTYAAIRPTIRITPDQSLPLDSSNPNAAFPQGLDGVVGLHPQFRSLYDTEWAAGRMAVFPASGMPDNESTTRSHFSAQEFWERGSASDSVRSGWLARVHVAAGADGPVDGVSNERNSTESYDGSLRSFNVPNLSQFGVSGFPNRGRAESALARMYGAGSGLVDATGAATLAVTGLLGSLDAGRDAPYPSTGFARDLKDVATLLKADVGLRTAFVSTGGWDHHDAQGGPLDSNGRFTRRVTDLTGGLQAFIDDMGPAGMAETTIVVISEFGRTIDENGGGGTDHGRGGTMLLFGAGVRGGVYGNDYPDQIVELGGSNRRALPVLTDYRQGLDEILASRVGIGGIFPTFSPGTTLGVAR